jgi:exosortase A-associated hydrolase 2
MQPIWATAVVIRATFVNGEQGALFQILHEPVTQPVRGAVLYVHPFAEELNKSRRMVALQARRLAEQGYVVLMPDLHGCGDSSGDFSDARWEIWLSDLSDCLEQLQARYQAPLILWGLRAGCLLISDLLQARDEMPAATLFWQPVTNGELHLTQFLRLRMAAGMMGGAKETTAQLRARLDAGEVLEVAGYGLAPALAERLAAARLQPPKAGTVCWLEVTQAESPTLPPASARVVDVWQQAAEQTVLPGQSLPRSSARQTTQQRGIDIQINTAVVQGESFWATQEICEVPALLAATEQALSEVLGR